MKQYYVRLKQTVVIEKCFIAENDDEAMRMANMIHLETDDSEFENGCGEREYDYALRDDVGRDLVYWGN